MMRLRWASARHGQEPKDRPVDVQGSAEVREYYAAIAPYMEDARRTYPDAKKRYLNGLPRSSPSSPISETTTAETARVLRQVWISAFGAETALADITADRIGSPPGRRRV